MFNKLRKDFLFKGRRKKGPTLKKVSALFISLCVGSSCKRKYTTASLSKV